jgi:protein-disulfide isomerase
MNITSALLHTCGRGRLAGVVLVALASIALTLTSFGQSARLTPEIRKRIEQQVRVYAEAPPEAQIALGEPHPSDMPGYDALDVQIRVADAVRSYSFVLSADRTKLLYAKTFDLTQDPYAKIRRAIDVTGRPVRGAKNGPVQIVIYDDFECPFCARMYIGLFNEVMNRYRDRVGVVLKDFPLSEAHPWAMDAAIAANCLATTNENAYWEFADYVHTHQQAMTAEWQQSKATFDQLAITKAKNDGADTAAVQACLAPRDTSAIEKSLAEGRSLGVSATPATFINGEFFEGVLTPEQLRIAIDRALREAAAP